jgi:hypothetical protein
MNELYILMDETWTFIDNFIPWTKSWIYEQSYNIYIISLESVTWNFKIVLYFMLKSKETCHICYVLKFAVFYKFVHVGMYYIVNILNLQSLKWWKYDPSPRQSPIFSSTFNGEKCWLIMFFCIFLIIFIIVKWLA